MKNKILEILESHPDQHVSGEAMAQTLHMTRANVWKEIQKLKKDGMTIESVRNLGYRLVNHANTYSQSLILKGVPSLTSIEVLETVDSTNSYAKNSLDKSHHLVIAQMQSAGKGRMGRHFHSPHKKGVYLSLNLQPALLIEDTQLLTICAALAVCEALESLYAFEPKIKWLNDIYLGNKKVCGILTEGDIELELNRFNSLTLGIGINTHFDPDLPDSLSGIYTALDADVNRNDLVIAILNAFYRYYEDLPNNRTILINNYKKRSNVLGKNLVIVNGDGSVYHAVDISREGHLIVTDSQGIQKTLNSGEISVKALEYEN